MKVTNELEEVSQITWSLFPVLACTLSFSTILSLPVATWRQWATMARQSCAMKDSRHVIEDH